MATRKDTMSELDLEVEKFGIGAAQRRECAPVNMGSWRPFVTLSNVVSKRSFKWKLA